MDILKKFNGVLRASNYPIEQLVLSHSSRSSYRACERKLEFRQFYGTPGYGKEESFSGEVGKALHHGLGDWLIHNDENRAVVEFLKKFPHKLEMLNAQNINRSLEASYAAFMALLSSSFISKYAIAQIKNLQGEIRHCIEVPFALKIVGAPIDIPVWYVGYIDEIMYDPLRDRYIVVDLKTTRQNYGDYQYRFTYDEQTIPYGIALEHALGKRIEDFEVNYLSVYIDLLEPKIEEFPVPKTHQDLEDWHRGLCDDIAKIALNYKREWFPRATDGQACISWNRKCQYHEECSYRDTSVLTKILQGTPRKGLFQNGDEPWIVAELPYLEG